MESNFKKEISEKIDIITKSLLSDCIKKSVENNKVDCLVDIICKNYGFGVMCDIVNDYENLNPKEEEYTYLWDHNKI